MNNNGLLRKEDALSTGAQSGKFGSYNRDLLYSRYCMPDEEPEHIPERVAKAIANEEKDAILKDEYGTFKKMIADLEFLPNSPTIMNGGCNTGNLFACFVLPIEDTIDSIYGTLANSAKIFHDGGGVGYSFSNLRPEGAPLSGGGSSSGPVSFMHLYDASVNAVKSGGKRRGASLAELNVNHPDIFKFIDSKIGGELTNFNISVGIFDDFMNAVITDDTYDLTFTDKYGNTKVYDTVPAVELFNNIAKSAWAIGDPGLLFLDTINKLNPMQKIEYISSSNPCGEVPLPPYGCCCLGSINLNKIVESGEINWEKFSELIRNGVVFLDNEIDKNKYPLHQVEEKAKRTRRIGLGFMGLADMFLKLDIPYYSQDAINLTNKLLRFMSSEAFSASKEIAEVKGSFPDIGESTFGGISIRNATTLSIAPTGSISMIANASSGIEPLFMAGYKKVTTLGEFLVITEGVIDYLKRHNLYSQETLNNISDFSDDILQTAYQIPWKHHIKIQATAQRWVDNSISKTINMPQSTTVEDVKNAYEFAYKSGCKGITIFREKSKVGTVQKCDGDSCYL